MSATIQQPFGTVEIDENVLALIAGITGLETEGIAGMSGGLVNDLSEKWGFRSWSKGIKVYTDGDQLSFDLHVIVQYGVQIHRVCEQMKQRIKYAIEDATGLTVNSINIEVESVSFVKKDKVIYQENSFEKIG